MKKNILFVIDSLHCEGDEKSLTTLLSLLNYSKYDVDLQLFGYGGALEELVPKEVNILKPMEYIKFSSLSTKNAVIKSLKNMNFKMLSSRLKFSLAIRKNNYSNAQKARIYWQKVSSVIEENNKEYPNRGLNDLVQKHGLAYIRRHFSYSILEIFSKNEQGRKQALARETYWKDVMQTRRFGYNRN